MVFLRKITMSLAFLLALVVFSLTDQMSGAICPFCSAINLTFWEQIKNHDVVVIAKLTEAPRPIDDIDAELPKAEFEVTEVVRGDIHVAPAMKFRTLLVGTYPVGQEFLVMGLDPPNLIWSSPLKASPRIVEYVHKLQGLPETGPERLLFFQQYFEDKESILAFDAYDEFAAASFADVTAIKDQMNHDQLIAWIKSSETSVNRRRLYFTMLGICGGPNDVVFLETLIKSEDRKDQAGLDALVACYLNLKGADGIPLIEEEFLKNEEADYVDTLATVSALRFHGTESKTIPKERLVAAVRTLLDRPKMADMIIPDLARWEDWSVIDKLVKLFKESNDETNWVRVPIIQYLQACPDPIAKKHIEELQKIDPDAVKRASFFSEFEMGEPAETSKSRGDETKEKPDKVDQGVQHDLQTVMRVPLESQVSTNSPDALVLDVANDPEIPVVAPIISSHADSPSPKLIEPKTETNVRTEAVFSGGNVSGQSASPSMADSPLPGVELAPVSSSTIATLEDVERPIKNLGLSIVLYPIAFSGVLFLLLWSVINGWFERLIF